MKALLDGDNLEKVINAFFNERYGDFGEIVKSVMEKTEQIIRKTLFANEYYYSELSLFPTLNHCKNHFYFELMKENCDLVSEEWYIPQNYIRGDVQNIFNDLLTASKLANECLDIILSLKSKIEKDNRTIQDFFYDIVCGL